MTKLLSVLLATLLALVTLSAHAGLVPPIFERQMFRNVQGEYLLVTNPNSNTKAYWDLVDTIRKSGYLMMTEISSSTIQVDNWCQIDIYTVDRVVVGCSALSSGHDLVVSRHIWWTPDEFKAKAYNDVPDIVAQLRDMRERASDAIGTNTK